MSKFLSICLMLFLYTSSSFAQIFTGQGGSGLGGFKFRALGNLSYEYMKMKSTDNLAVKDRSLNGLGLEGMLGFQYSALMFLTGADLMKFYQMTDVEDVGNTNFNGNRLDYLGAVGLNFGNISLIGKYYFNSTYSLDKKTSSGSTIKYLDPDKSMGVSLLYNLSGMNVIGIDYKKFVYKKFSSNDVESNLNTNTELNTNSIGVSYGFIY